LDGLFWNVLPHEQARTDITALRENVLHRYRYRGYADSSEHVDDASFNMASMYQRAFIALAESELAAGNVSKCREVVTRFANAFPRRAAHLKSFPEACRPPRQEVH
jgi:hypothetical protein